MIKMDRVDRALLAALAKDPRATVVALADQLNVSRNTVQARMVKLESSGAILGYERAFSPGPWGYPLQAFLSIGVRQARLPQIVELLGEIPEVLQVHGLSGRVDLMALVACRDTSHLFDLDASILGIDGVERTETAFVMRELVPYRVLGLVEQ
ncbi:Lrp/AsnC family transcriptional regulator [Leucobacter celer]|uniref:Lrp/AsnC family transcriptional regulator n=1 Tax=Leucobacter celer TaxID=668625 RepID=UPI0006A77E4D|nr:Lrp/AsnC family transcriptional regulator [Leucobacter celer]